MFISLFRVIKLALKDFRRNLWLSTVTTAVLILTFASINGLILLNFLLKSTIQSIEAKVDVSLYFEQTVSDSKVREIRSVLNKIDGIIAIRLIEPEEALASFEKRYERDQAITEALDALEKNPFGPTLVVRAESPLVYRSVLETISSPIYQDLIADHTFDDHILLVEKIGKLSAKLNSFGVLVSITFGIIALLIAMTTVRVAIYTHRETIGIMKLVGASNWFVRAPYLIQGFLMSVLAVGVSFLIMYASIEFFETRTAGIFGPESLDLAGYVHKNLWKLLGGELGTAVVVNLLVMNFAVGRYLKV